MLVPTRHLELSEQRFIDHLGWWFGPSVIFVFTDRLTSGCEDDPVVQIQVRGYDGAQQQSDGMLGRIYIRRAVARNGELIKLARPGSSTAAEHSEK
jgi:hypothetical protein